MPEYYKLGIVGMGPAGIGMAMSLRGTDTIENTICFERGSTTSISDCSTQSKNVCCCSEICNIISGVGGASTVSSGKISDYPAGSGLVNFFDSEEQLKHMYKSLLLYLADTISLKKIIVDDEVRNYTNTFYKQRNIEYKYYDVYEFDGERYRSFLQRIIQELCNDGLQLYDNTEVLHIDRDPETMLFTISVKTNQGKKQFIVHDLVLAIGSLDLHSALIESIIKPTVSNYEVGLRVEAPSDVFKNTLACHGDLKLKFDTGRTYCVTENGNILSYKTSGLYLLEGCCDPSALTNFTNMAILVKIKDKEDVYSFLKNYREKFNGIPIKQRFVDYINMKESGINAITTLVSAVNGDINRLFPTNINNAIKDFIQYVLLDTMNIDADTLTLVAPELKILRNLQISSSFSVDNNCYVIGAATGRFRGILQSFCSGIRCGQLYTGGKSYVHMGSTLW